MIYGSRIVSSHEYYLRTHVCMKVDFEAAHSLWIGEDESVSVEWEKWILKLKEKTNL